MLLSAPRLALAVLTAAGAVSAATIKATTDETCNIHNNHLDPNSWAFVGDCDQTTYCAEDGTCRARGCRRDMYPVGYSGVPFAELPMLCPEGQFCPDEMDQCMDVNPVGGQCQKDRDEQCQPPDNAKDYATYLNVNGSICLNFQCYWANVTAGQSCVVENTVYQDTTDGGVSFAFIISRDNCINGFYCDGSSLLCLAKKHAGDTCTGNKECFSYNCMSSGVCGKAADEALHPKPWVYAVIGIAIVLLIVGVLTTLWFLHKRWREETQLKLQEYYNEQVAYRQSIMSMSHAKNSLLSLPANTTPDAARASLYQDGNVGYSSALGRDPMLPPNVRRASSAAYSDDSNILLVSDNLAGRGGAARYRG